MIKQLVLGNVKRSPTSPIMKETLSAKEVCGLLIISFLIHNACAFATYHVWLQGTTIARDLSFVFGNKFRVSTSYSVVLFIPYIYMYTYSNVILSL